MVTTHRAFGYRFVIFTNDHAPAHIHIMGKGCEAKVQLGGSDGPELIFSVGIPENDLRRLLREVAVQRTMLLNEWNRIHG